MNTRGYIVFASLCVALTLETRPAAAQQIGPWRGANPIAGNESHSLGLKSDGRIIAWGDGSSGQTNVPAPNADFVAVAAGRYHSLGLKSDGRIVAWGDNTYGQTDVPAPNADFVAVAAGELHSLGLKSNGCIVAWGSDLYGQTNVPAPNADFVAISARAGSSLGLKSNGCIAAWGDNEYGQTDLPAPNSNFTAVAAGELHGLGLKSDGSIVGWGYDGFGQTDVPAPNSNFVAVVAGAVHSMGLKSNGCIVAWGWNTSNQTNVPPPDTNFVAMAAGSFHSLGLKSNSSLVAWGAGSAGQTDVPGPNTDFGQQSGIVPPRALTYGGTTVVILGSKLGNGTDVTNVTLCGVSAMIVTQSPSRVVVQTGAAAEPTNGNVVVYSTGYGAIVKTNGFSYVADTYTSNGTAQSWMDLYGLTNDLLDTDLDGVTNWAEYVAGTDPTNGASYLRVNIGNSMTNVLVSWANTNSRTYSLWLCPNLITGSWQSIKAYTNLPSGITCFSNYFATNRAFFRITVNTNL